MGCRGKPCACPECGPFVISPKGQFQTLDGRSIGATVVNPEWTAGTLGSARNGRIEGELRPPFGSRLSMTWMPESDVGRPAPDSSGYTPLPEPIDSDESSATFDMTAPEPEPEPVGDVPIGARPSVPARLDVSFEQTGRGPSITREPYGLLPLELTEQQVFGTGQRPPPMAIPQLAPADAAELNLVQPIQQFIPPLPASQNVCIVNGFNPGWGTPPTSWRGVVMRFDPAMGAYAFNPNAAHMAEAFEQTGDPHLMVWFHEVASRYQSGFMLQPYKPADGSGRWDFRWIPRRQEVVCT